MLATQTEYHGLSCPPFFGGWTTSFPTPQKPNRAEFVETHAAALNAVALRLCGNPHDARDLVQDTFERALRSLARDNPLNPNSRPWLLSILHHLFIDRCRAAARDRRLLASSDEIDEAAVGAPEPDSEPASAWETITQEQLRAAVDQLGANFRDVYVLHAVEHCSYKEIAARLSISQVTVGTRLIRARRRLKELLLAQAGRGRT